MHTYTHLALRQLYCAAACASLLARWLRQLSHVVRSILAVTFLFVVICRNSHALLTVLDNARHIANLAPCVRGVLSLAAKTFVLHPLAGMKLLSALCTTETLVTLLTAIGNCALTRELVAATWPCFHGLGNVSLAAMETCHAFTRSSDVQGTLVMMLR